MPAGRPTKYNKDILAKAREYLTNYAELGDAIPSVAGLAVTLGIARDTGYDWAKQEDKKDFSDTLDDILSTQERVLFNKGLTGDFNSNITKLALANHGYSDKSDLSLGGQKGNPIESKWTVEFVDAGVLDAADED